MKLNYNTCLSGRKCMLVPYRPEHVPTYHEWMQDPHLLEMTGSEALTYQEEIDMQKSWKQDGDKCTFIVLMKEDCDLNTDQMEGGIVSSLPLLPLDEKEEITKTVRIHPNFITKNLKAMVGDVNLFLTRTINDDTIQQIESSTLNIEEDTDNVHIEAELDIMIAAKQHQRKGLGTEAVCLMMVYGARRLGISRFFVKIKDSNTASRNLFEKVLGFRECNYAACFKEVELEFLCHTIEDLGPVLTLLENSVVEWSICIDVNEDS